VALACELPKSAEGPSHIVGAAIQAPKNPGGDAWIAETIVANQN
jgi:hypothetical protein